MAITLQFGRNGGSYHTQRGKHSIVLISPSGTRSDILKKRARDTTSDKGFENWEFMTVLHWDESPKGVWKLEVSDAMNQDWSHKVLKWRLKFSGTCDIKNVFNIEINETEICGTHCRRDCPAPQAFSEKCVDCSRYCDCTTGECVSACDESLVADNTLKHCKRSMERGHGNGYNGAGGSGNGDQHHVTPAVSMPLSAKFAIICLSLVVVSVMVAGIAYFAAKMPSMKNLPKTNGYHSMARYPCADGGGVEKDDGVITDGDEGCGVEIGLIGDEDEDDIVIGGDEEKAKLNVIKS